MIRRNEKDINDIDDLDLVEISEPDTAILKERESLLNTFKDYLYIKHQSTPERVAPYLNAAKHFLDFVIAHSPTTKNVSLLDRIDLQMCTAYIKYLLHDAQQKPSTVNTTANRLKLFLRYFNKTREADLMPIPPMSDTFASPSKSQQQQQQQQQPILFFPEEVIKDIIDKAPTQLDIALVQTMYFFALRRAEVPLLKRGWINHDKKTMKIYRVKTRYPWQILPFSEPYSTITDTYGVLTYYMESSLAMFETPSSIDITNLPVFITFMAGRRKGLLEPLSIRTVNYRVELTLKYAVKAGCRGSDMIEKMLKQERDISTHIFRHSRATNMIIRMIEKGEPVSLFRVQSWLGHKMQQHTTRYIHLAASYLGIQPEDIETVV